MDWKEALGALRGNMPEGAIDGEQQAAEPTDKNRGKKERLVVSYERKGRGGKEATIISGFADATTDEEIADLASTLKKRLGIGGSSRGGEILLQGDARGKLPELLKALGYRCNL